MRRFGHAALASALVVASCGGSALQPAAATTQPAAASSLVFVADIEAAPGLAGDPEASCRGMVTITLDPTRRPPLDLSTARFELSVVGCPAGTRITAAHIHRGQEGEVVIDAGITRLDLSGGSGKTTSSNTGVSPRLIDAVASDPAAFIFNWHSERHPAAGFRGQLRRA